jgi:membrane protein
MLAIFPALIALVSVYGLVLNPADVPSQVEYFSSLLPPSARPPVQEFLHELVLQPTSGLSLGLLIGLIGALWSASRGTAALIRGINIAYDRQESRSFIRQGALAIVLTLGFILFVVVAFVCVAVLPNLLDYVGLEHVSARLISVTRWPVLSIAVFVGCTILYRIAPNRTARPPWRWVVLGSAVATILWLVSSMLFSIYASHFGDYSKTYGTLAGVVVLLLWLFVSAFALLVGAELNAAVEREAGRLAESRAGAAEAGASHHSHDQHRIPPASPSHSRA